MFENEEIPSSYIEDYKTLHHDIGLVRRSNGTWDLWFGQDEISKYYKNTNYLKIIDGDIVTATEIHSLQVGIVIACLTSWNYLNRTGNPIYTDFGNESYSLLKKNKGVNTRYKIKQYFIDCLNRMRRVYSVESLDVYDVENNPYVYKVVFKVLSITNTLVDGEFYLDTDSSKNTSIIDISYNHPYTSTSNPLNVECTLKNEYGSVIENELLYVYIRNDNNPKFNFYGVTEATNYDGITRITIPPKGLYQNTQIMFVFKGNSLYNPAISKIISIQSVAYYIKSRFVDSEQHLYIEDSIGNAKDKFRLGELLSDYIDISNLGLPNYIPINVLEENYLSDKILEYDDTVEDDFEKNLKLYLIPTNRIITGTNKYYYKAYSWDTSGEFLSLTPFDVQLNSENPYEIHFLIEDDDNGLFEIDFDDGHLYYHIDLIENEM